MNTIFSIPHFKDDIILSSSIEIINGKQASKLPSLTLPTTVTSIDENCFKKCDYVKKSLKQLKIPTTVVSIPKNCLQYCSYLTNITLPLKRNQIIYGNQIF